MSKIPPAVMDKVNLDEKFARIHEHWSPKIAAELNGQHVKLAKLKGAFEWHHHEDADELFLVVQGRLTIRLRTQDDVVLEPGEFFVVPRGIDHQPVAEPAAHVVLFEPVGTLNTGNQHTDRTRAEVEWI